jgi:hypothetical protein
MPKTQRAKELMTRIKENQTEDTKCCCLQYCCLALPILGVGPVTFCSDCREDLANQYELLTWEVVQIKPTDFQKIAAHKIGCLTTPLFKFSAPKPVRMQ